MVRNDDAKLTVSAETGTDLTSWSSVTVASVDTVGLSAGLERRVYTATITGSKQFLRLKAVLAP